MDQELPNLLTQGGVTIVVMILIGVVKSAMPGFDSGRFGAMLAILLGVALVAFANWSLPSDVVGLTPVGVLLTGILGGAASSGIYDAGKGGAATIATNVLILSVGLALIIAGALLL